jgi:hypothetical protein
MHSYGSSFHFPAELILQFTGLEKAKNLAGEISPPDSDPFSDYEFGEIWIK